MLWSSRKKRKYSDTEDYWLVLGKRIALWREIGKSFLWKEKKWRPSQDFLYAVSPKELSMCLRQQGCAKSDIPKCSTIMFIAEGIYDTTCNNITARPLIFAPRSMWFGCDYIFVILSADSDKVLDHNKQECLPLFRNVMRTPHFPFSTKSLVLSLKRQGNSCCLADTFVIILHIILGSISVR